MTRLHLSFECQEKRCAATLDNASGNTGLLIVSGGNEIRAGAFNGQARLAADIAAAGFPVFRFDRRGIGDSEGQNRGFRKSGQDIRAAMLAFRAIAPQVQRIVGLGNCDAASALMLEAGAGCEALVLANPWTIDEAGDDLPPASAVRSRYTEKLKDPKELARLVSGKVDMRKLARGLVKAVKPRPAPSTLADEMHHGLTSFSGPVRFLLADADRTAQTFAEAWTDDDPRVHRCQGADHAFTGSEQTQWLRSQILEALRF